MVFSHPPRPEAIKLKGHVESHNSQRVRDALLGNNFDPEQTFNQTRANPTSSLLQSLMRAPVLQVNHSNYSAYIYMMSVLQAAVYRHPHFQYTQSALVTYAVCS